MEHNDRTIITRQGFISLTAKQSLARLFSPKNAILACESSKQLALGFTSASASWRFDRELNMFFLSFCFFLLLLYSHPLESGCLGKVQGVVGM